MNEGVEIFRMILQRLNQKGFNYYTGDNIHYNRNLYDRERDQFIVHERDFNLRSYLSTEIIRGFRSGQIPFRNIALTILPHKLTADKFVESDHCFYMGASVYPENKTKLLLCKMKGMVI